MMFKFYVLSKSVFFPNKKNGGRFERTGEDKNCQKKPWKIPWIFHLLRWSWRSETLWNWWLWWSRIRGGRRRHRTSTAGVTTQTRRASIHGDATFRASIHGDAAIHAASNSVLKPCRSWKNMDEEDIWGFIKSPVLSITSSREIGFWEHDIEASKMQGRARGRKGERKTHHITSYHHITMEFGGYSLNVAKNPTRARAKRKGSYPTKK